MKVQAVRIKDNFDFAKNSGGEKWSSQKIKKKRKNEGKTQELQPLLSLTSPAQSLWSQRLVLHSQFQNVTYLDSRRMCSLCLASFIYQKAFEVHSCSFFFLLRSIPLNWFIKIHLSIIHSSMDILSFQFEAIVSKVSVMYKFLCKCMLSFIPG